MRFGQLADGVFASIAEEGDLAVGNAGFVDLGSELLVFDTHVSLAAGRELRAAAEEHGPARIVVLSHWHGDHVYGTGAFDATVVATARTAELMHERTVPRLAELKATTPEEFADTPFAELVHTELPMLELRHPDETFEFERPFGRATAITYGGGHTLSDAILWLPGERIVFAADLVVSNGWPWVGDGDIEAWPGILRRIGELEPRQIVPGHGDVTGPEVLETMFGFLEAIAKAKPGDPNPFPELPWPEMWERNLTAIADRPA